jgi:putative transcriptional regulator
MNEELVAELLESVREGGAMLRGEKAPARRFEIESPNVKQIRERYELSQSEFAALLGVSTKTLQNWEQGRRTPQGAARVLLQVAARHPQAVWDVVGPAIYQMGVFEMS